VLTGSGIYWEASGTGDAVLLIHGLALDSRMWDDQFSVFAATHRVIRFDLPGAGRSVAPTGPWSLADATRAVLDDARVTRAHVVGLSLGGRAATDFALAHPAMVGSLVLIDAVVAGYRFSDEWRDRMKATIDAVAKDGPQSANERWLADPIFAPAMRDAALGQRLRDMVANYSGAYWANPGWITAVKPLAIDRLSEIAAPTLVIVGELDLPDFVSIAGTLARGIPGARKLVIPGVGHMANMEAPATVNRAITEFWSTLR
jgi:3-oxoadipate enol-lactonase